MLGFAVLAFAWIPAGLILISRDSELRSFSLLFEHLWPLTFIPLCAFGLCWFWRRSLYRRIKTLASGNNAQ
jgi:hypothetical protein